VGHGRTSFLRNLFHNSSEISLASCWTGQRIKEPQFVYVNITQLCNFCCISSTWTRTKETCITGIVSLYLQQCAYSIHGPQRYFKAACPIFSCSNSIQTQIKFNACLRHHRSSSHLALTLAILCPIWFPCRGSQFNDNQCLNNRYILKLGVHRIDCLSRVQRTYGPKREGSNTRIKTRYTQRGGLYLCSPGLRAGWSGVRVLAGAGNFSLHHPNQTGSGAHPASYPMGTRGSFPGVKRPRREADHSPPPSAEVKNAWSYTSTPPTRLHDVVLS
jgi:hypothetical protein